MLEVTLRTEQNFVMCPYCDLFFPTEVALQLHLEIDHRRHKLGTSVNR